MATAERLLGLLRDVLYADERKLRARIERARKSRADATEWQRIGNQIDAAAIFARADLVSVHGMYSGWHQRSAIEKARRASAIQSKNCI